MAPWWHGRLGVESATTEKPESTGAISTTECALSTSCRREHDSESPTRGMLRQARAWVWRLFMREHAHEIDTQAHGTEVHDFDHGTRTRPAICRLERCWGKTENVDCWGFFIVSSFRVQKYGPCYKTRPLVVCLPWLPKKFWYSQKLTNCPAVCLALRPPSQEINAGI